MCSAKTMCALCRRKGSGRVVPLVIGCLLSGDTDFLAVKSEEGRSWHPRQGQLETAFLLIKFSVLSDPGFSLGTGLKRSQKWPRNRTTIGTGEKQALGQKIGVQALVP